jgi:hypothetical protein
VLGFGCDHPDRFPARAILALKTECPCCSLYRALAVGMVIGAAIVAALCLALK